MIADLKEGEKMKKKNILPIIIPLIIAIISVSLLAVSGHINGVNEGTVETKPPKAVTTKAPEETTEATTLPQNGEVSFIAVGDNLIHDSIYLAAPKKDGKMDFTGLYENIKPYAEEADVAIMNQETVLGGDIRFLSGYPMFNSPQEVGDAAVEAGFDVFTCATNHALDVLKADGLMAEMKFYEKKHPEVMYLGINKSEKAYNTIKYLEKNNITDIQPLRELDALEELYLAENDIKDYEPLEELGYLTNDPLEQVEREWYE